ncbi:MAG: OmpA family protein [Pseudomonadota bacterium]|nr:OmpA family protein [Pseudomonadota bacterium]MDP1904196.1 OmpA family protein [Pseudomonadota bacterium]
MPQHIGWTKSAWRVCEGDACPAPTAKTVVLPSPRPVISLPPRVETRQAEAVARKPLVIQFVFAKAIPTKDGMASLESATSAIHSKDTLHIEGHTDDLGVQALNDKLARKRAEYVAAWLKQRGIKNPMEIESHGKCCYAVPNDSEERRARNRRVEVRFSTKEVNK